MTYLGLSSFLQNVCAFKNYLSVIAYCPLEVCDGVCICRDLALCLYFLIFLEFCCAWDVCKRHHVSSGMWRPGYAAVSVSLFCSLCGCLTKGGVKLHTHTGRAEKHTEDSMACAFQLQSHNILRVVQKYGCVYLCFRT